jgi:hypothetical protein
MKTIVPLALCVLILTAHAEDLILRPSPEQEAREQADAHALAERRQAMIEQCEQNHGSPDDCRREVDTELRAEQLMSGRRVMRAPGS